MLGDKFTELNENEINAKVLTITTEDDCRGHIVSPLDLVGWSEERWLDAIYGSLLLQLCSHQLTDFRTNLCSNRVESS